jgi:hypothetical protein
MDDGGAIGEWAAAETTRRAANANDVSKRLRCDSGGVLRQRRRRRMRQRQRRRRAAAAAA